MRIGIHLSLWAREFTDSFVDDIDRAASLGFTCVEIPLMEPADLPVNKIKDRIQKNNLKVYCGTGLGPETDISASDPAKRKRGREHLLNCIQVAAELGSDSLGGVIHSAWGKKDIITGQDRDRAAFILREVADKAGELEMKLALECINRYEGSFLNTVDQGLQFLDRIARDNVGLHLDTYHMNIEENSIPAALVRAGSRLFRVHLSENNRGFPGSGLLNWRDIIETLKAVNYGGDLVIESYVEPATPVGDAVCIWREIEGDRAESLQRSRNIIKSLL